MKKVLLVDDNQVLLRFMTRLLEKRGYLVQTAEDGLSALNLLKSFTPDIVFCDLIMPNIGGDKLCRVIRSMPEMNHVFLIVLSAIVVEEEIDAAQFGADACIAKGPFDKMQQHVLEVLEKLEHGASTEISKTIIGREDVYERIVTKELLSSKRHFEVILSNLSEGFLELNREGKIIYANPAAARLIGMPEEQLLGAAVGEFFAARDYQRIEALLQQNGDASRTVSKDSPVILHDRQISLKILPVQMDPERHYVVIFEDVTEAKRLEAQLQQARKMEAIGTLSGGIAHDFNNLLMGIQGNVSLMLLDVEKQHPHFDYLKKIETVLKSASKLTAQILGYARKGKYELKLLSLNALVSETSDIFQSTRKGVAFERSLDRNLWPVEADQVQIEQVLYNLYINAWQAMPDGGTISLSTRNVAAENIEVKFENEDHPRYVLLTVQDDGIGMDKETLERIFDPFFTTKPLSLGTGLGLASAYGIIKNHGGHIEAGSEKNQGTTFHIYLPASGKELKEEAPYSDEVMLGTETILLVDDDEIILDVGKRMLQILGYEVITAANRTDAVNSFNRRKQDIALVILDVASPVVGGEDVYRQIKEIHPEVNILLSAGFNDETVSGCIFEGCAGSIQKPFNIIELSQMIRHILDKKPADR